MYNDIVIMFQRFNTFKYSTLIYLTLGLILLSLIFKYFIVRKVERSDIQTDSEKLQNIKRIKEYGRFFILIAIFCLWFSQLQSMFVSLFVFASAIVLALKEVIMCVTGGILIKINKHFKLSDRIEVDGIRGYVLEKSLTTTKVLELGTEKNSQQTTGNIITIPNSVFLSKTTINQSYFKDYSIRSFVFSPIDVANYQATEELLVKLANELSAPYLKKAKDSISKFCRKEGIILPTIEPRVKILLSETNDIKFLLKMPVDNKNIAEIEQRLIKMFLLHKHS